MWVKNPDYTITKYLQEKSKEIEKTITVNSFVRYERGEGIEKRKKTCWRSTKTNAAGYKERNTAVFFWSILLSFGGIKMSLNYKRIMLKLSGEALAGPQGYGIDFEVATRIAKEIKELVDMGIEVGAVVGAVTYERQKWNRNG